MVEYGFPTKAGRNAEVMEAVARSVVSQSHAARKNDGIPAKAGRIRVIRRMMSGRVSLIGLARFSVVVEKRTQSVSRLDGRSEGGAGTRRSRRLQMKMVQLAGKRNDRSMKRFPVT